MNFRGAGRNLWASWTEVWMRRHILAWASLFVMCSATASAAPFEGTELLVGHGVKANSRSKVFSVGMTVGFAPLNVLLSSQKQSLIDMGIDSACGGDPACKEAATVHADEAMDALGQIGDSTWDAVTAAAGDSALLAQQLKMAGLGDSEVASVVTFVEQMPPSSRKDAVEISKTLAQQKGSLFLVEPNMEINLDFLSVRALVPLALMMFEDENDWSVGNLTFDVELGMTWDGAIASTGISGGLLVYLPSGSRGTDALALSDLFQAPKYAHQFLGLAPYFAAGIDGTLASLQLHGQLVNEIPVRDAKGLDTMQYLKWGTGVTLLQQYSPVAIIGEINGLVPISNADLYDAIFAVVGLQLNLVVARLAAAVQLPLVTPDTEKSSQLEGVDLGEMAKYTVITRLMFSF